MIVVTHSGSAHIDEIMAVAMLSVKLGVPIAPAQSLDGKSMTVLRLRGEVAADLAEQNKADYVIDIGAQHDPSRGWFDHHQFPPEAEPACALSLVADHLGIPRAEFPWIDKLTLIDSKGPFAWFKKEFGRKGHAKEVYAACGQDSVFNYITDVANYGEGGSTHPPGPASDRFLRALGMCIEWLDMELRWSESREKDKLKAMESTKIVPLVDGLNAIWFEQDGLRGVNAACDDITEKDPSVVVSLRKDERGVGLAATRLNDDERVNFYPRKGEEGCVFAHASGFIMKWRNDYDEFLEAVKRSVHGEAK